MKQLPLFDQTLEEYLQERIDRGRPLALAMARPLDQVPSIDLMRYRESQRELCDQVGSCEANCQDDEQVEFRGRVVCRRTLRPCPLDSWCQQFKELMEEFDGC